MNSTPSHPGFDDVLVTGVGLVTPLGNSVEATWNSLLRGERAGRALQPSEIDHYEPLSGVQGLQIHGAPVNYDELPELVWESPLLSAIPTNIVREWLAEPLVSMSLAAVIEAMKQSRLTEVLVPGNSDIQTRIAVVYGSSKGGLRAAEQLTAMMRNNDNNVCRDEMTPSTDAFRLTWQHAFASDSATRAIAAISGASAGISCPVAACATGLISVLQGAAMIQNGLCDVCIVGSADAGLRASVVSSFHRLRVTSRHSDAPTACRPFDVDRDGFLIGEGAGVLILESRHHAETRGVHGLATVAGGLWLSDPTGMTQIDQTGTIVAEVLRRSVEKCGTMPEVISVHGTGTESNDLAEARGIHTAFGNQPPACFGVKGAMGHLLGAAGSVETILTVLALRDQIIPGTTNLNQQDSNCRLRLSSAPVSLPCLATAAKLSLGFGGHVACGIFHREPTTVPSGH